MIVALDNQEVPIPWAKRRRQTPNLRNIGKPVIDLAGDDRKGGVMGTLWRRLQVWWLCRRVNRLAVHKEA